MPDLRTTIYARDQGVCARCGLDSGAIDRMLAAAFTFLKERHRPWVANRMVNEMRVQWWGGKAGKSLWEADHLQQQAHDGSDDPDNVQTLCVQCHAQNTAIQAGEHAKEVRVQHSIPGYDKAFKATRAKKKAPNKRMPGVNAPVFNNLG